MQLNTYLLFNGDCQAALDLYQAAFGAQINALIRFRDTPHVDQEPPSWQDKIMHGAFSVGPTVIMVSDGRYGEPPRPHIGFTMAINSPDAASGTRAFHMLSAGGQVLVPWEATPWTSGFGVTVDRFGIPWTVTVADGNAA